MKVPVLLALVSVFFFHGGTCAKVKTNKRIICENKQDVIKCGKDEKIQIISANYGRTNRKVCPHSSIRTTKCSSKKSMALVKKLCQDKNSCKLVASNNHYGDPCGGTYKYLEIDYRCIATVKLCKGSKCHPNAQCSKKGCKCKRGFYGDGVNNCEKSCLCMASGDPHYKTYDGDVIHFMGDCKYTLSKSTLKNDKCAFNIEVKNERRGNNKRVSYTRFVDVTMFGVTVRLHQNKKVFVDEEKVFLPYESEKGDLQVEVMGKYVQLKTSCGVYVKFDGKHAVSVVVPGRYKRNMVGLCGNCDGVKNDFRTLEGVDVSKDKRKYELVGNSYVVLDDSKDAPKVCKTEELPEMCSKSMKNKVSGKNVCGILKDKKGVFAKCIAQFPELAEDFFQSCVFDACAESQKLEESKCSSLEAFAEECEENGIAMQWRNNKLCPLKCNDPNMVYSAEANCQSTSCARPEYPEDCKLEPVEGCVCKKGFVLSDEKCVPVANCGCLDKKKRYYPLNSVQLSSNCKEEYTCKRQGFESQLVKTKSQKCDKHAKCKVQDGERQCVCKDGYEGNGLTCYSKKKTPQCKRACHPKARCVKGRCVCNKGLYGDGVQSCEKSCLCKASGDPHYKTYDNQMIHFMGECQYTLSKSTIENDPCSFNIEVKNEFRGKKTTVSYTRFVQIEIFDQRVRLGQKGRVYVNGKRVYLPHNYKGKKMQIFKAGRYTQLKTWCGVQVNFDGNHAVSVVVPSRFSNKMVGLCGNCDGRKNDYQTLEGVDVSKEKNRYSRIGNSYIVKDRSKDELKKCEVKSDQPECPNKIQKVLQNDKVCGLIVNKKGPFAECIKNFPDVAQEYFDACVFDICSNYDDKSKVPVLKCNALEAFAEECEDLGNAVQWRMANLCPMQCGGKNMVYSPSSTGCPATCADPDAEETCDLEPVEGCVCKPGFVLSDDECVPQNQCGCLDEEENYFPIGAKKQTDDCEIEFVCLPGPKGLPAQFVEKKRKSCDKNAECLLNDKGERECVCKKPFTGNGLSCKGGCGDVAACHENAKCRKGKCVCKKGYFGDGVNSCEKSCLCMASGDPHYKTYDRQMIHFMGECQYTLSKSTVENDPCSFNIEVKNEFRGKKTTVSYTRFVLIEIFDQRVRLGQKGRVYVNGKRVYLPHKYKGKKMQIFKAGRFVQLKTVCGVQVNFDGNHAVSVVVPSQFSNKMVGLCGDCDGRKNDYQTLEGVDVSQDKNRYSLIGNSYLVQDRSKDKLKECKVKSDEPACPSKMRKLLKKDESCGLLVNTKGPFAECIKKYPDVAQEYFDSCVFDLCSNNDDKNKIPILKCNALEAFAEECEDLGFAANWRNKNLCPMQCEGNNMVYSPSSSGCPATCADPNAEEMCDLEPVEGCVCKPGYLLSNDECVPQMQCGCLDEKENYFPIRSKKQSDDCKYDYVCLPGPRGLPAQFAKKQSKPCDVNAECLLNDEGEQECVCKKPYTGNGQTCTVKNGCGNGPACHENANCKNGKCVCKKGYTGDGINSCEIKGNCGGAVCHKNAKCKKDKCVCKKGYTGDGINTCEVEKGCGGAVCHENAECKKDKCVCKKGFAGDGINTCEVKGDCGGAVCHKNAKCKEDKCVCRKGYTGDGINTCKIEKGCGGAVCHKNAKCKKDKCVCKKGFTGDGINTCEIEKGCGGAVCHENAECKKDKCVCKKGFTGDGINTCEVKGNCGGAVCHKNAKCKKDKCVCKKGYTGDGINTCEIEQGCGGDVCHENAECKKNKCVCKKGFTGDGINTCEIKGSCRGVFCHKNAKCKKDKCVCKKGYTGDGINTCEILEGCGKGPACHENARCKKGKCVCKKGYTGDGINSCEKSCLCMASGDPHYKTFDNQMIHFMGECQYTLSKSTVEGEPCSFNIEVKNEYRKGKTTVTYTRFVLVEIFGHRIKLGQKQNVFVNNEKIFLPYNLNGKKLQIYRAGRYVQLRTFCGVQVNFDGNHAVSVIVPSRFSNKMIGLCGNCDGLKNDYRTLEGVDVSEDKNRYSLIGNSYIVKERTKKKTKSCVTKSPKSNEPVCSKEMEKELNQDSFCGLLVNKAGPFGECITNFPDVAQEYLASCIFDLCSNKENKNEMPALRCNALEAFAEECDNFGIPVTWRSEKLCPLQCEGKNMVYSASSSGCPATCSNLDAEETCDVEPVEGCVCKPGFVLSDNECVPQEECGCTDEDGKYYPVGVSFKSRTCGNEVTCKKPKAGAPAVLVRKLIKECSLNGECVINEEGIRECRCKKHYIGDGFTCGKEKPPIKTPVEKPCICTATGDPHYFTYDSQMLSFMGLCKYTLSRTIDQGQDCAFNVEVKNRKISKHSKYSYTRYVDVEVYGWKIRLDHNKNVVIEDQVVDLPLELQEGNITVYKQDGYVQLRTACGVVVDYDGKQNAIVSVDSRFQGKMDGICGNCDNIRNDYVTKEGIDVSQKRNKGQLIGQSYVVDDEEDKKCRTDNFNPECKMTDEVQQIFDDYCLQNNTIFAKYKDCITNNPILLESFTDTCKINLCVVNGNLERAKAVLCGVLTTLKSECVDKGYQVKIDEIPVCNAPQIMS